MKPNPNCRECKLWEFGKRFGGVCRYGKGSVPAKVFFIIDQPEVNEGDTYAKLAKYMGDTTYYVAYGAKCFPGFKQRKPKNAGVLAYRNCFPYLHDEWQEVKPNLCVILGSRAFKMVFSKLNFTEQRGKVLQHPVLGKCMATFSLGQLHYEPNYEPSFVQDIKDVLAIVHTGQVSVRETKPEGIEITNDRERILAALEKASKAEILGTDVESNQLEWYLPGFELTHFGTAWEPNEGIVFDPRLHPDLYNHFLQLRTHSVHGAHFEGAIFPRGSIRYDTLCLAHLDNPSQSVGLENVSREYLGATVWKGQETNWDDWAVRNAVDISATRRLVPLLLSRLDSAHLRIHDKITLPASCILGRLLAHPILVDTKYQREDFLPELNADANLLIEEAMRDFHFYGNLNSADQVRPFMYNTLGIDVPRAAWDDDGDHSTAAQFLAELELKHRFAGIVRAYRKVVKLRSNYIYGLSEDTFDLRAHFKPCGTKSGRPSAKHVQTFAKDPRVRRSYISRKGRFVAGDLVQAELVMAGAIRANDACIVDIVHNNLDMHIITCTEVIGAEPTKANRNRAKPVNFLLIYGGKAYIFRVTALKDYGVNFSDGEAAEIRRKFFRKYSGLDEWHARDFREIMSQGFVVSELGRKYPMRGGLSKDQRVVEETAKYAHNHPVQGDIAMLALLGAIEADKLIEDSVALTVHDEVITDVDDDIAEDFQREWSKKWSEAIDEFYTPEKRVRGGKPIPIRTSFKQGPNLRDLTDV